MNNHDIALSFKLLADLMDLYGGNKFKVRSYEKAYSILRKVESPLSEMSTEEISGIEGVGSAISKKIEELLETGEMKALKELMDKTPEGIIELISIRGIGTKKIKTAWKEAGITTPESFLDAAVENRLVELPGFGAKTQQDIAGKLSYYISIRGMLLYREAEGIAMDLLNDLRFQYPESRIELCGEIARKLNTIKKIEFLTDSEEIKDYLESSDRSGQVEATVVSSDDFGTALLKRNASEEFLSALPEIGSYSHEEDIWQALEASPIPTEYRESIRVWELARGKDLPKLITDQDIKGVIHNHSTYSDGVHSLEDIAGYAFNQGYEYFVITDHSKSAGYANGLSYERVEMQWREIDQLNNLYDNFKIFKGIECDILSDGSMDYNNDFLERFDVVIASIHSGLNMTQEKATTRIIKAIENPHVDILGHMTGRLLLTRAGYPVDHYKVIDACIKNDVVIELNANPRRLDMDWSYLPYALDKGAMISINPDAHSKGQIGLLKYGVISARKGGLTSERCLSTYSLKDFQSWVDSRT